jgi:hypothetical protein
MIEAPNPGDVVRKLRLNGGRLCRPAMIINGSYHYLRRRDGQLVLMLYLDGDWHRA